MSLKEVSRLTDDEKSFFDQPDDSNKNTSLEDNVQYDIIDRKDDLNEADGFRTDDSKHEENLFTSSIKNIIPLDKLKNGWFNISTLVIQNSTKVQEKIIETYNSESVKSFKQNTMELVTPVWERTCETAAPVWERTCETAAPVWEQTKINASYVADNIKPSFNSVFYFIHNHFYILN